MLKGLSVQCYVDYSAYQLVTRNCQSVGAPSAHMEAMTRARMARVMAALNKNIRYSLGPASLVSIGRVVLQEEKKNLHGPLYNATSVVLLQGTLRAQNIFCSLESSIHA